MAKKMTTKVIEDYLTKYNIKVNKSALLKVKESEIKYLAQDIAFEVMMGNKSSKRINKIITDYSLIK